MYIDLFIFNPLSFQSSKINFIEITIFDHIYSIINKLLPMILNANMFLFDQTA